jgi:hypothetical protein
MKASPSLLLRPVEVWIYSNIVTPDPRSREGKESENIVVTLGLEDLPTWVPNWSLRFPLTDFNALDQRTRQLNFHRACRDATGGAEYLGNGRLRVRGILCGVISKAGVPYESTKSNATKPMTDWLKLANLYELDRSDIVHNMQYKAFQTALTQDFPVKWMSHLNGWSKKVTLNAFR